jgi:hypothetical protein
MSELQGYQEVEGHVWCIERGMVHDDSPPQSVAKRQGVEYWDLYEDGTLCTQADHFPLFVNLPVGLEL